MKRSVLLFLFVMSSLAVSATHLRGGSIKAKRVGGFGSRRVAITITVYTDTDCPQQCILFGGSLDVLDFGDGTSMLVPETPNSPLSPPVAGVGRASFTVEHTFGSNGRYIISYLEPNRNGGVLNMDNSVETTFYVETQIDLSVLGQSNSPYYSIPPVDIAAVGKAFYYNPAATDIDGDSLSYELVVPFRNRNTPVVNYREPNHSDFYTTNYNQSNEEGNGPPTFSINPTTGTLIWDAPGKVGEYNIAFRIKEWRKIDGVWVNIGFVRIDRQIIVENADNERPRLSVPDAVCVEAGATLIGTVLGTDPDSEDVKIEAFSEIFESNFPSRATIDPTGFQPLNPSAESSLTWNTTSQHVRDQPYQVVFRIVDSQNLVTYETWQIKIIGRAPTVQSVNLVSSKFGKIEWDAYTSEATKIQIWRKVGDTNFTHDSCDSGMPVNLGFSLLATISSTDELGNPVTSFTDTNGGLGLAVGAQYCYRLVLVFPLPRGGESYVSNEICLDPILATAPVITNVSISKTGNPDGEVVIQWEPPFDIDAGTYPGPYEYIVQRSGGTGFITIGAKTSSTLYTDTGLDTYSNEYSYRVILFSSASANPVDTSSVASAPRLELIPQTGKMILNWIADVPWSNSLQNSPMHMIYRGDENADEVDMILIDSVNVTEQGFSYTDEGKLEPNDVLDVTKIYCYRIKTRGGYGNSMITLLDNSSQIECDAPFVVGTPDENVPVVNIYPNPAEQFLRIDFTNSSSMEILLYDQQGRLQLKQIVTESTSIDLRDYSSGLYYCVVRNGIKPVKKMRIVKN